MGHESSARIQTSIQNLKEIAMSKSRRIGSTESGERSALKSTNQYVRMNI